MWWSVCERCGWCGPFAIYHGGVFLLLWNCLANGYWKEQTYQQCQPNAYSIFRPNKMLVNIYAFVSSDTKVAKRSCEQIDNKTKWMKDASERRGVRFRNNFGSDLKKKMIDKDLGEERKWGAVTRRLPDSGEKYSHQFPQNKESHVSLPLG